MHEDLEISAEVTPTPYHLRPPGSDLRGPNTASVHVTVTTLPRGWAVEGWYSHAAGDLRLVDLRVFRHRTDIGASISTGTLRSVPLREMLDRARETFAAALVEHRDKPEKPITTLDQALSFGARFTPEEEAWIHGASLHDVLAGTTEDLTDEQLRYLEAAVVFVRNQPRSRADIAAMLDLDDEQMRGLLHGARRWKYLTSQGPGTRGGRLTELGEVLAAKHLNARTGRRKRGRR